MYKFFTKNFFIKLFFISKSFNLSIQILAQNLHTNIWSLSMAVTLNRWVIPEWVGDAKNLSNSKLLKRGGGISR